MTTLQLLARLRGLNIKLWAEGDRLRFQAPKGALTDELRAALAEHKAAVLALLQDASTATQTEPAPIQAAAHDGPLPLSFAQQRLWFLDQLEPGSAVYNIPSVVRVTGQLDRAALQRSLDAIVARHAALRTTFATQAQQPVQIIAPPAPVTIPLVDLRHLPAQEREATARQLADEEALKPFDLQRGPLLRVQLLQLDRADYLVLLTMHHVVSDGWSIGILIRELALLYRAFVADQPSPLPPLPIQYADYAVWQRQWLQDQGLEQLLSYWQQQLHGANDVLELPTDRPRPPAQTFAGATLAFQVPLALTQALTTLSQREGATLFMTLLAAWNTLIYRYTGQTDIVIGSPIAGRTREELEGLIGVFINTLVLRTDLSGNPTFVELLGRVRQTTLGAFAHQDLPFERLVEALRPTRDMSRSPLFQVTLALQNTPYEELELPDLIFRPQPSDSGTAKFDLSLSLGELPDGLAGVVEYNTDLFDAATIERMMAHYHTLLDGIVAQPSAQIADLPLLTAAEQQQLLAWNSTAAPFPHDRRLPQLFEEQAAALPDAIAVTCAEQALTYRQLDRRANQLAHQLQALGVGPDVCVGLYLTRSLAFVIGALGVIKAGGAYLPLDPAYPAERLRFMLADAQAPILLTQRDLPQIAPTQDLRVIHLDSDWPTIAQQPDTQPLSLATAEHLAYVIYTSGSTGLPKGVGVSHRGALNLVTWHQRAYDLTPGDRATLLAGLAFDASVWEIWPYMSSGASLHLPTEEIRSTPGALVEWLIAQEITLCFMPTPLAEAVIAEPQAAQLRLRALLTGGDVLHVQDWSRLAFPVINHYGPTENTVVTTCGAVEERGTALPTIGRPIANTQVHLLDPQLQPVPIGVPGELYIGGESLARGYLNRPALTAEKFVPDPFSAASGSRLYRTGDLARYLADGAIEFIGRIDHQVKLRGFRIEIGEIEAVILRHPQVRDAVVVVRDDSGNKRLVAYVTEEQRTTEQRNSESPSPAAQEREREPATAGQGAGGEGGSTLRSFLQSHLPDYMVPSAFVVLDALPLTPNGKVDRRALPAPDSVTQEREQAFVAPRTAAEATLVQLWSDVLGSTQIGVHDNFFELGGHSLLATQLVSRMREILNVELPLREIFAAPTVAELAARIEALSGDTHTQDEAPLVPVDRTGPLPLSFAQQRLWFLDQFEPNSTLYSIPSVLRITGRLDLAAFERSINTIISRHEILRTSFTIADGQPVQVIAPPMPLSVPVVDLRDLAAEERETTARQLIDQDALQPFDLQRGPLLRVQLLQLDDQELILIFTTHHIISDGWSVGVIVNELGQLYSAYVRGAGPSLPELPIQYADFAVWQRQWLSGDVLDRQLRYWTAQLGCASPRGAVPLLDLPTDRPRPSVQTFEGTSLSFTLPQPLVDRLMALSQAEQVTPFMTLLAAFNVLLQRYSGQNDIAVGTPIAGRTRREIEPLIGFFINTLVLRTDLSGAPAFRELLQRVRQVTLGAYEHQDIPFEMLVDTLQPTRQLSHNPLFQVMFIMQNTPTQALDLPDARFSMVDLETTTAKTDLTLEIVPIGETLTGIIGYNTDLFDRETIERLLTHFVTLLDGIVANPALPINRAPLLTDTERQQMLVEWNQSMAEYPRAAVVHELIEAQAARTPNLPAIVYEGASLTYTELNARANQLAHYLRAQGVGPDVLVALCVERSLDMIVGMLAILKAGGAYVPLDPNYPAERVHYMLEHSRAPVIVTQAALVERLPEHQAQVFRLDADWHTLAEQPTTNLPRTALPDNLAYIIYTSGSTGRPKGVMVTQQGLINLVYGLRAYFDDPAVEITGLITSISFDISVNQIFPTLIFGRTLHIIPDAVKFNSRALVRYLDQNQLHLLDAVPSYMQAVLNEVAPEQPANALRYLLIGGEKIEQRLLQSVFGQFGPAVQIVNIYGLTEISDINILGPIRAADLSQPITVGRPLQNNRIYILDAFDQPQPIGIAGEVCVSGESVSRGYLFRPELTASRFVVCPFEDGQIMVRTGDLGRWRADGTVEILGRLDHQVKIRGFRIETGEIEAVLATHPSVNECVVVVREDTTGDKRLVGYVGLREGMADPSIGELRQLLSEQLPEYMIPAAFVLLPVLPKTPSGKTDRTALPEPELQAAIEATFVAPTTPTEELLAQIWADVLGVERIGTRSNFFELGGHSLLATQLVSRIREAFQVELPLREVFAAPTVASMAVLIETMRTGEQTQTDAPLIPVDRSAPLPLSFAQQRLWFLDQLEPGSPLYNIPTSVRLRGSLDRDALQRSIDLLTERHESLRTTFAAIDGQAIQIIAPIAQVALATVDLRDLPSTERETAAQQLAIQEAQQPFDLQRGPLMRATLVLLATDEHLLVLTLHHIITDGWSMGVLIRELAAAYLSIAYERPLLLPELPVQYADFAVWQRDWFQGPLLAQQLDYWKQQLRGAPAALDLPTDRPRPAVQSFRGAATSFMLPLALSQKLTALSQQEGATLFMTLLAAWQTLLFRITGQDDISVGSPIANRTRQEIEGLIGFFVNTLVLRTDLSGDPSFTELLGRARQVALGAFAHQDLPFEYLVEAIQPERDLSRSPLFQVMLVLQNTPSEPLRLPDLTLETVDAHSGTAKFDLLLALLEQPDGLSGTLEYNTDLFDPSTITRLIGHFETLLNGIVANPVQPLSRLPLLTAAEHQQQLVDWNATAAPYPTLAAHQLVEAQAARTPEVVAVVFGDHHLTYAELNARANQLAHYLRALGVGPDVPVGLCLTRSLELVVGMLGILKAGGAYVPLDPNYPAERLALMLRDAQAPVVLTAPSQEADQRAMLEERFAGTIVDLVDDGPQTGALWMQQPTCTPENTAHLDDLAYVIYTSGSTGIPKGVAMPHRPLANMIAWQQREIPGAARTLQFASPSFDVSFQEIFTTWASGGTLVLPPESLRRDPEALAVFLDAQRIERLFLPFVALQQLAEVLMAENRVPASLREVITAGEQLQITPAIAAWFAASPHTRLHNHYGPSETHVVTAHTLTGDPAQWPALPPIGNPIANTQAYVLDRHAQPLPIGAIGDLYFGGDCLARGYLHRPDLTAERFILLEVAGTSAGARRLYKTGDLARYRPDGVLDFLGRVDTQVKIRGFRIEPGEIENVLAQHPAVREAVVVVRPNEQGVAQLVAYVVENLEPRTKNLEVEPDGSQSPIGHLILGSSDLRAYLKEKLPDYMVPSAFVVLEQWPLTPSGKIDRRALPAPGATASGTSDTFVAPRDTLELRLAGIWERLLGARGVGIRDNFFELGGHSLLVVRLMAQIQAQIGQKIPLATLFQEPTVEHLARTLRRFSATPPNTPLIALQPAGDQLPFFCVHPAAGSVLSYLELTRLLGPNQPFYGLQAAGLEGEQAPLAHVEDMAALYLAALRAAQPEGPYLLGGWSFGGLVAYEMACQLTAQGEDVALLALFDSWAPATQAAPPVDPTTLLLWFANDLGRTFGADLNVSAETLTAIAPEQRLPYLLDHARKSGMLPPDIAEREVSAYLEVFGASLRAMHAYQPRPYAGRVTLLRAGDQPLDGVAETLGWEALAADVTLRAIPGDHYTIVRQPHVAALAQALSVELEAAHTQNTASVTNED